MTKRQRRKDQVASSTKPNAVVVTGASGHIGRAVCRVLRASGTAFLAIDSYPADAIVVRCDLREKDKVARLFRNNTVGGVIHLAAILPTAFHSDPLTAVDVNLNASFELMRQSVNAGVPRFVFASSMSVYGLAFDPRPRTEDDPTNPNNPYGASKRVVETVGESLRQMRAIDFVALRIARAIGPGVRRTSSPWRSQIFECSSVDPPIRIPFGPEAVLSLVHIEDIARMLVILAEAPTLKHSIYNTPAESWEVNNLKKLVEERRGGRVELGPTDARGGPLCNGTRFSQEFGFDVQGISARLSAISS